MGVLGLGIVVLCCVGRCFVWSGTMWCVGVGNVARWCGRYVEGRKSVFWGVEGDRFWGVNGQLGGGLVLIIRGIGVQQERV